MNEWFAQERARWEAAIQARMLELLGKRSVGATICPSDVARAMASGADDLAWRSLMPRVRAVSKRLAHEGRIEVTQGGHVVDPLHARGPVRLRLVAPATH